jgi:hypothetical protein
MGIVRGKPGEMKGVRKIREPGETLQKLAKYFTIRKSR